jgi:hypothetical protein
VTSSRKGRSSEFTAAIRGGVTWTLPQSRLRIHNDLYELRPPVDWSEAYADTAALLVHAGHVHVELRHPRQRPIQRGPPEEEREVQDRAEVSTHAEPGWMVWAQPSPEHR